MGIQNPDYKYCRQFAGTWKSAGTVSNFCPECGRPRPRVRQERAVRYMHCKRQHITTDSCELLD